MKGVRTTQHLMPDTRPALEVVDSGDFARGAGMPASGCAACGSSIDPQVMAPPAGDVHPRHDEELDPCRRATPSNGVSV